MHVTLQVRDEFVTRVSTLASLESVSKARAANLDDDELPAAVVHHLEDEVEAITKTSKHDPGMERRTIPITVTVVADGADQEVGDVLTGIRAQIEAVIAEDERLGGLARVVDHTGMTMDLLEDEDGERWYAAMVLGWNVEVWTIRGDPETAI